MKLVRRFIKTLKTLVFLFLTQFLIIKIFSITGSSRFRRISFALWPSSQLSGHGVASSEENDEEASRNSQPTLRASRFKWSFGWFLRGKEISWFKSKLTTLWFQILFILAGCVLKIRSITPASGLKVIVKCHSTCTCIKFWLCVNLLLSQLKSLKTKKLS